MVDCPQKGKTEVIWPRLRAMHTMYYDLWTEWSDMDLRSNKMLKAYNIDAYKTYPAMRIIPELRRNGFKGAFHKLTPYEIFYRHSDGQQKGNIA